MQVANATITTTSHRVPIQKTRGDAGSKLQINYAGSWAGKRAKKRFRETENIKRDSERAREKRGIYIKFAQEATRKV